MNYVQCRLQHKQGRYEISWIPEKYAVKDKILDIKVAYETWEENWRVIDVFSKREESDLITTNEMHRHHRAGSDI